MQVKLPTGLTVEIRGMLIKEQRVFADKKANKSGQMINNLVKACVVEIVDPGVYGDGFDWADVAQGDMFAAAIAIRAATFGAEYEFKFPCPNCGHRQGWSVDIMEDLPRIELSDDDLKRFTGDNNFTLVPDEIDGCTIHYKVLTSKDEKRIVALRRQNRGAPISAGLLARITKVEVGEGEDLQEMSRPIEILRWLPDQPMGLVPEVVERLDEVNCGVETAISVYCDECEAEAEINIPFEGRFWMPHKKRKTRGM